MPPSSFAPFLLTLLALTTCYAVFDLSTTDAQKRDLHEWIFRHE